MSPVRVFTVKNRLAMVMARPGGKMLSDMLRRAERRVEALRGDCLASLERQVDQLRICAERAGGDRATLTEIYAIANEVFAVTATFGPPVASQAAFALCELIDHFREAGAVAWPAIEVHVKGLKLLIDDRMEPEAAEVVLAGLLRVRTRFESDDAATPGSRNSHFSGKIKT